MTMMHNPAHPGEVLREWIPEDMTVGQAAQALHQALQRPTTKIKPLPRHAA